jgi:hypothetical protein
MTGGCCDAGAVFLRDLSRFFDFKHRAATGTQLTRWRLSQENCAKARLFLATA